MTPQIYAKLSKQIERQTPELADYEAQVIDRNIAALNLQPAVDAAQAALDDAQLALDAAQAKPEDAPDDWQAPDCTAEQAAVTEAQTALDAAKAAQAKPEAERDQLQAQANTIRAAITQCQAQLEASGMTLTQAEIDAIANAPLVPRAVTMRQARLALLGVGKLSAVDAAINGMSEPTKSAARIEWEYSGEVQRHNGFVSALGPALGLTSDQIDQLFVAAAKL